MLTINLEWDSNAQAAPQSFRDGVAAAAAVLQAAIYDPITVNIQVGYGEYDLGGPQYTVLDSGYSYGGVLNAVGLDYPALRLALAGAESSASDTASVNALPSTATLNGQSQFEISTAEAKAFGVISPTASAIDGYIGFPTSFTGSVLVSTAIVEEVHALGLLYGGGDLGLFAYTSPGNHFLPTGATASTPAYFSLDGGTTRLANYNVQNDPTLFLGLQDEPLDFPSTGTALTQLDLSEISAIGFDTTSTPVLPNPDIAPIVTAAGSSPTIIVQNVSVAANAPISALSMIKSASVASGDSISSYLFYDAGDGTGHFSFNGSAQPDGQSFSVLDTQLHELSYVGGSAKGQETVYIAALDITTNTYSAFTPLTATTTPSVSSDFNGDGSSDILFQNVDGTIDGWLMNGLSLASSGIIANPTTAWTPVATGDFDGDGKADILYQDQDGTIDIWQMNGLGIASSGIVANPGPTWHAIATGDFDGDSKSDILFQNDDGSIDVWTVNGMSIASSAVVANPGTAWHAIATGDFNGDGKSDILFQNDNGAIDVWEMNGSTMISSAVVANPSTSWRAVGTGDFSGDGKSDIVLQNKDGTVAIWTMNGLSMTSSTIVADPGPAWHAVAVGDYNGDGKSDILFQNDNGAVDAWLMNGTALASSGVIANPSAAWQEIGLGSMHFIDGTQSPGTLAGTIMADNFVFTTSTQGMHIVTNFDPLHDVITLDQTNFNSYTAVQSAETTVNGSTVIALGAGDTLTINGVLPTALAAKNFV